MSVHTQTFDITGMSCAHCVRAVEQALRGVPGATVEEVTIGKATVSFDDAQTSPEALAAAIEDEGYEVTR